jgi:toxin ParE1/3/4
MKPRDVVFAPEAEADLVWIYDTIASAADPATAFRYIERIDQACSRLDLGSERGTKRNDIRNGLRIIGFERRVTIAFTVTAERVEILRVFYGGVNWEQRIS